MTGAQIAAAGFAVLTGVGIVYSSYDRKTAASINCSGSRKEAYDKAFYKGEKREPIFHSNGKFGPHFHPASAKSSIGITILRYCWRSFLTINNIKRFYMETNFVNNFIIKQRQERILFEFQKKRDRAVDRFAHGAKDILKSNKIILSGEHLQIEDIVNALQSYGILLDVKTYIISGNVALDKKSMSLREALKYFFTDFLQIIITDGECYALIKEETSGNYAQKYILINK